MENSPTTNASAIAAFQPSTVAGSDMSRLEVLSAMVFRTSHLSRICTLTYSSLKSKLLRKGFRQKFLLFATTSIYHADPDACLEAEVLKWGNHIQTRIVR